MTTPTFDRKKYDRLLSRGLPSGLGTKHKACIMGALNLACGGELSDAAESPCVLPAVARFLIRLNDARWSTDRARAEGMRDLGLAALGTDELDRKTFASRLAEATIREVVSVFLRRARLEDAAKRCETEGTTEAARAGRSAAYAAYAAAADADAADAADAAAAAAADAAAAAAAAAADGGAYPAYRQRYGDETLILSARIATRILTEMKAAAVGMVTGPRRDIVTGGGR